MACHLSSKLSFGRPRDAKGRHETMIGQCDCARDFREQGGGGIRSTACRFDNGTDKLRGGSEEIISGNAASNNGQALIQSCLNHAGINGLARAHLNRQLITLYIL